jgi:hypothetical protein
MLVSLQRGRWPASDSSSDDPPPLVLQLSSAPHVGAHSALAPHLFPLRCSPPLPAEIAVLGPSFTARPRSIARRSNNNEDITHLFLSKSALISMALFLHRSRRMYQFSAFVR